MFVTKNQFYVFLSCVTFGCVCAILLSIFAAIKFFIKNKTLKVLIDVAIFTLIAFLFRIYSYARNFPNFRVYMFFGVLLGMFMYFKSFHILLAKYTKKFYNIINRKIIKNKKAKDERNKVKKVDSRNYGRRCFVGSGASIDNGVSTNINSSRKQPNRKVRRKNRRV